MEYVKLYHDLLELLPSGSIQELMEIAYRHIRKPILATDVTYQLLGIYPQQKTGKPYLMWTPGSLHGSWPIL